jgi:hypothetical protein
MYYENCHSKQYTAASAASTRPAQPAVAMKEKLAL